MPCVSHCSSMLDVIALEIETEIVYSPIQIQNCTYICLRFTQVYTHNAIICLYKFITYMQNLLLLLAFLVVFCRCEENQ